MIQRFGSFLQKLVPIDQTKLDEAAMIATKEGIPMGRYLIEFMGFSESSIYQALANQFMLEFLPSIENELNMDILRELPPDLFREGRCFPLGNDEKILRIAVSDPLDFDITLQAQAASGYIIETVLTTPSEMERVSEKLFKGDTIFKQSAGKISQEYEKSLQVSDEQLTLDEIKERTESEPIVRMVNLVFNEAIKLRASDIHIEPSENNAIIRFRIDGMLRQHTEVSKWMFSPLTSRIKILADLDIAEKRIPQDGRIRQSIDGEVFDFRVSTLPTHFGEKTVIRILKHDTKLLDLQNIGIANDQYIGLAELIEKPQGMIFVTGPTGSGKSSTLFACLNKIKHKAINITTIENPIEYKLEGVNQVQINEKAGITFAAALRSILRQDPDVILVGEIRDGETAQIAVQASQTGHLVFSTLHTNDAVSAVTRLRDLGIPGFLISSSLIGILAQRLVRVLCPECKKETVLTGDIKRRWDMLLGNYPLKKAYEAVGCEACNFLGYKSRTGIFELVVIDEALRALIADNENETTLRKTLRDQGFLSLVNDGILKVEQGITTPEELLRVVLVEDIVQLQTTK